MKQIMRWHSRLGLFMGLVLLFVTLSGIVLLFQRNLMWLGTTSHSSSIPAQPIEQIHKNVTQLYPKHDINGYRFLGSETEPITVVVDSCDISHYVFMDRFTAQEVHPNASMDNFLTLAHDIHTGIIFSTPGVFIVLLCGFAYFFLTLTGVIIFRKQIMKVLSFRLRRGNNKARYYHYLLGVWSIPFNFILAFSSIYLIIPQFVGSLLGSGAYAQEPLVPTKNNPPVAVSLNHVQTQAHALYPDFKLNYLRLPNPNHPNEIRLWGDLPGSFHTGELATEIIYKIDEQSLSISRESEHSIITQLALALHTLHAGQFGGIFVKLIYALFSLFLVILNITGYVIQLNKYYLRR